MVELISGLRTIWWEDGKVFMVDQNKLPWEFTFKVCSSVEEVAEAIKDMTIRGAPAIGAAAAMGLALAAYHCKAKKKEEMVKAVVKAAEVLRSTRPTARNLFWAIERVLKVLEMKEGVEEVRREVLMEALRIADEDVEVNRKIGETGVSILEDGDVVLTHCNAGALATVGYGTALAPIREAVKRGLRVKVIATETRPKLQGARLTALELKIEEIPVKVITDGMVGYVMREGMVNKVIVGADRVFKDGHVVNKVGTLTIAVVANHFNVPFYVAAPTSTFDLTLNVEDVTIEMRGREEVASIANFPILPSGVEALNPAFDVTPPYLVTGYITEKGILRPPFTL